MHGSRTDRKQRKPTTDRSDRDLLVECADRMRRVETRVTRFLENQGFDTQVQKPQFVAGKLQVTSPHCSIAACIEAIPEDWELPVDVFVGEEYLITLD